ncbi:MAG: SdpI family protein [Clostridia bacterium]|nr:SdpI family protein [Clostridia bacterium]
MIKKNLKILLITTVVILLPIIAGLILWNNLPDEIPIHFNAEGVADGWGGKGVAVFALPLFMLAIHWICVFVTSLDPKSKNITSKNINLVLWITPVLSVFVSGIIYSFALGHELNINTIFPVFFGLFFIVIGNFMPKCKQNYSIGVKVPWALESEENWNYTHRLAGKTWVIGGLLIIALSFLNSVWIFMAITIIMVIIPVIGSYLFYKKENKK